MKTVLIRDLDNKTHIINIDHIVYFTLLEKDLIEINLSNDDSLRTQMSVGTLMEKLS